MKELFVDCRQGHEYILETVISDKHVRITIHSDFYQFQSWAVAKVFHKDSLTWNKVASIHYSLMQSSCLFDGSPAKVRKETYLHFFKKDAETLLKRVEELLLT